MGACEFLGGFVSGFWEGYLGGDLLTYGVRGGGYVVWERMGGLRSLERMDFGVYDTMLWEA